MQYYRLHLHHHDICYASPKRGKYSSDVMQCFKIILSKETKDQTPLRAGGSGVVLALFKDACPLTEVGVVVYYHVNGNQNSHALYSPRPLGPGADLLHSSCNRSTHSSNHRPYIHKHSQTFENDISNLQPQARWNDLQQFTSRHIKHKSDWLVTYEQSNTEAHVTHSVEHLFLAEELLTVYFTKFSAVHFFREFCGTWGRPGLVVT